jgi:hypothetical protein
VKSCWFLGVVVLGAGCAQDTDAAFEVPAADPVKFRTEVYPTLLADCGFAACHGTHERFFSVFGPGRTRLDPDTPPYDPATPDELALSYTRARSMLLAPEGVRRSPLLRKPLAVEVGGAGHEGVDVWGANIYTSKQDPRFQALFFWATAEAP